MEIKAETPDIETSSADYASRFRGAAGRFLLEVQSRSVMAVLQDLPPGRALDVGGGHGQLLEPLRALGWRVTVHGSSPECERNLRELHGIRDCEFLQGDLRELPAANHSFELVIAVRLLSHMTDWPRLLAEMCRVSCRAVVLDYPSINGLNALTPWMFGLKRSLEGNTRTYTSFSRAQLCAEVAPHGFALQREVKQLFLPMVAHRVGRGSAVLRGAEALCRLTGLTALAGSPALIRFDRAH